MSEIITNKRISELAVHLFPSQEGNMEDDINASKRFIFELGALQGAQDVVDRIHSALKGLGLEKHSIALNVLKIAAIELPKS